jgi:ankyrin repeat protein
MYFYLIAVYNNRTDFVNLLIKIGTNLDSKDSFGLTPLHYG